MAYISITCAKCVSVFDDSVIAESRVSRNLPLRLVYFGFNIQGVKGLHRATGECGQLCLLRVDSAAFPGAQSHFGKTVERCTSKYQISK